MDGDARHVYSATRAGDSQVCRLPDFRGKPASGVVGFHDEVARGVSALLDGLITGTQTSIIRHTE